MRFSDKREEFANTIEIVGLLVSLGAVFLQIWVLITAIEFSFKGVYSNLFPSVILSGLAFVACGFSVFLTNLHSFNGLMQGRSKTYQNKNP